jgi:hypothetical protein
MARLEQSLVISRELGMRPLMERVLSRRDVLKAQSPRLPAVLQAG